MVGREYERSGEMEQLLGTKGRLFVENTKIRKLDGVRNQIDMKGNSSVREEGQNISYNLLEAERSGKLDKQEMETKEKKKGK